MSEELIIVRENGKPKGIRNTAGYVCFLREVSKYTGQQERYEKELAEADTFANLFAAAPELLAVCKSFVAGMESGAALPKQMIVKQAEAAIAKATE